MKKFYYYLIIVIIAVLVAGIYFVNSLGPVECITDSECEPAFFCCGGWKCISNNEAYLKENGYEDCMVDCLKPPKEEAPINCECVNNNCYVPLY